MKPFLTYEGDFYATECGSLARTTASAVARQFADDPTPANSSLLLSVLLQNARSEWSGHSYSIEHRGGVEECAINTLFNALHELPYRMKQAYAQDRTDCGDETVEFVENDDLWMKRIVLSGGVLLEQPLSEEKTKFFLQYICYFLENRLGCETIKRLAQALAVAKAGGAS